MRAFNALGKSAWGAAATATTSSAVCLMDLGDITNRIEIDGNYEPQCRSGPRLSVYGHDARWYSFTITERMPVRVYLYGHYPVDAYLYLLSGASRNGGVIAQDDDSGVFRSARIDLTLGPGTYTAEVSRFSSLSSGGSFTLSVTPNPPPAEQ